MELILLVQDALSCCSNNLHFNTVFIYIYRRHLFHSTVLMTVRSRANSQKPIVTSRTKYRIC